MLRSFLFALGIGLLCASTAISQSAFTYQGQLKDLSGAVNNASLPVSFQLFDAQTGGAQIGGTVNLNVNVQNGLFTTTLDFDSSAFNGAPRWLEITVNGVTLSPRQPVTATPYSIFSQNTRGLNVDSSGSVGLGVSVPDGKLHLVGGPVWTNAGWSKSLTLNTASALELGYGGTNRFGVGVTAGNLYLFTAPGETASDAASYRLFMDGSTGNVGLGTLTPTAKLEVAGGVRMTGFTLTGNGAGASKVLVSDANGNGAWQSLPSPVSYSAGVGLSLSGLTFFIPNNAITSAMLSSDAASLNKVSGGAMSASSGKIGIGTTAPQAELHVNGQTRTVSFMMPTNAVNGYVLTSDANGNGRWLAAPAQPWVKDGSFLYYNGGNVGIGTQFPGNLLTVAGVGRFEAVAIGTGAPVASVDARSTTANGYAVFAQANVSGATALYGTTNNSGGFAGRLFGAVTINGNLTVNGTVAKTGGAFKIDHPLDPENKYLWHSFVESPDMMNVYNGNVTTDDKGEAWVELPSYFQALNRDFRYQLTIVEDKDTDEFCQVKVARQIRENRFKIKTSAPHVQVSWQVTGIRQDAWANMNRIPNEQDKPEDERGYYLSPEAFGQPAEKGIPAMRPHEIDKSETAR